MSAAAAATRRLPGPPHTAEHRAAVGAFIRATRHSVGLSQAHVARGLGISAVMMHHIEVGRYQVPRGRAEALAGILGEPVEHFLSPPLAAQDDQEADLLIAFRHLREDERGALLALVRL